jgi:probable AcnD-accessory protein PrpF
MTPLRIPAVYMRGGSSKGVFFHAEDLPADFAARDRLLLRVIGSPDPYGKQIDGMGGGTSSTSKIAIISRSQHADCDVDYLFGAVSIDSPVIDWSGNCGNLSAAVGPFAISEGLVPAPNEGTATVRIWQENIGKRILAHVPMQGGNVMEEGDFLLDGVTFPAAEIKLEFLDPGGMEGRTLFPYGRPVDTLDIPEIGTVQATLINAGNPTVFIHADRLGLAGTELPEAFNRNAALLARCEAIRSHAAVAMGLAACAAEATAKRPATPKLAFVAAPQDYLASNGQPVSKDRTDLVVRILSMGKLHHAMTGTGAVAVAVAAAVPGTIVHDIARCHTCTETRMGHPSGVLTVGATAVRQHGEWTVTKAIMSRSARRLMEGWVRLPSDTITILA